MESKVEFLGYCISVRLHNYRIGASKLVFNVLSPNKFRIRIPKKHITGSIPKTIFQYRYRYLPSTGLRSGLRLDAKIVSCIGKLKDAQKNLEDETLNRINIQNQLQTKEVEQFLF